MDFLLNRHTSFDCWWKMSQILFGLFFPSVDPCALTERTIYGLRAYGFWTDCGISVSRAKRTATHSYASDWPICKINDFWAISYCFAQIVMLIRIQMNFVLCTTISLLFVREGHFWIILKKGRGSSPQTTHTHPTPPHPSASACWAEAL